jgi:hypothetical protein
MEMLFGPYGVKLLEIGTPLPFGGVEYRPRRIGGD